MSVKNNQVQFLRGIACLVIVFFHYYCRYEQIYFNNYQYPLLISEMGTIGVLIFWLLSGYYLIPNREINSIQYILNRGYKLYPPYLISIIMIYLLSFSGYLGANREVSISDFLKNVIMVNGFIASPYVDGAHWYLTYTVTFILIASILILLKKQHDINYYMIWLLINVILCMSTKVVDNPIIKILLLMSGGSYAPVVIIGVIFRQINENILETNKSRLALIFSFFAILLTSGKLYFLEALIMSCIVWVVINKSVKIINKFTWVISIGNMSYIIYLIHQNIGYMILNYFNSKFEINNILLIFIASAIIIMASWMIKYICDVLFYKKNRLA